ncbi:hypothetical protein [Burkholderia gladioli]|uniref:Chemotaxis methyl-accepting receptor HlyB-like 4HB MCP domain-containing protein n=1 Tax=Burkholderia gladioli TaxID=28095 RepID=A0AAW3F549_BURGA|nr:hypothetical protein [Burkholderia gladioli]AJW96666.1 hypothetical protein BM43_7248 [Burkholderia gladioli]ASD83026.1 hypothetical protein CEJ98_29470 [Burkholderia gladioli pv. gladioli]AWY50460.1 hypothetical protein A8H28_04230 [Burkholderia gladioli pv. gladioli]KGC14826.1 hypothetical protein DM48_516 [Burkholderia gladioli]MBU9325227.1 hypothetical protein [Burkholderia gladioli]
MSVIEGFERKALFNITRAVALVCVTVFLIGIAGGIFFGISVWQERVDTRVSANEIVEPLKQAEQPAADQDEAPKDAQQPAEPGAQKSPLAGFKIPFSLQKYLEGDNARIIRKHLDEIPAADRQPYLDELGAVVSAAEAAKIEVFPAINAFMETKRERYKDVAVQAAQKMETLKIVAGATASGLLLVALFSLVLVLLAIERNTRPMRQAGARARVETAGEMSQA